MMAAGFLAMIPYRFMRLRQTDAQCNRYPMEIGKPMV